MARPVVVLKGTPPRTVEVLVLTAVERPEERDKPQQTEQQRAGDEPGKGGHFASSKCMVLSLTALAVTAIEEADMAMAASSGVTRPAAASGTKIAL